jgi:transcription-repair coupling factor (superfamily II helicase)
MWNEIEKHPFIQKAKQIFEDTPATLFEGLWDSPKALLSLLGAQSGNKNLLIITGGERETRLFDDLAYFSSEELFAFPSWETLPGEEILPSPDIIGKRFEILARLQERKNQKIVLAPLQAILQKICSPSTLQTSTFTWKKKDSIPFETIPELLSSLGYRRETIASDKGEFAIRGGILDLFPSSASDPYRIDFFGDEIEDIRSYDPISQKSIEKKEEALIVPASEMHLLQKETSLATLLDYLGDNTLLVFDDLLAIEDRWVSIKDLPGSKSRFILTLEEFFESTSHLQKLYFTKEPLGALDEPAQKGEEITCDLFNLPLKAKRIGHPFLRIETAYWENVSEVDRLKAVVQNSQNLHIFTSSKSERRTLETHLSSLSLPKVPSLHEGYLSSGFVLGNLTIFPYTELTKRYKVHREKWRNSYHTPASEFHQLEKGDLVVHFHNGIGKFLGIEKQKNHLGNEEEFMILEYAGNSKLYVPLSQSHLVSRYIGTHEQAPKLHTLGTKKWHQAKMQTQKAIVGYARDLLSMQAKRKAQGGFVYPPDSEEVTLFEAEFPFTETEDQIKAISEIKTDMSSSQAMDRLICGDVGYGKTEVAMRAAFKAVIDGGKQVAVLVPTTVLAMQHYETFVKRMENFPVRIGVVSRFVKPKQVKETLKGVLEGSIDILVGTHRLVSNDVIFKDLGLIIIDEEQRFGVRAKEHLKKIKTGVDCLTLSATPIPRTLYFSLVGARDMSVINTPPHDRLPIKTILAEKAPELMKNALLRELARDGQAYVIHNRVESIYRVANEVETLLPSARVGVVHGQMSSDEIDALFHRFKQGEIQVLIATTIVENGVDIPNANTILIDRADAYGMADLYQLRGRVGRWNRAAYAYLLVPKSRELHEISRKRLQALIETSGFGGGMKLAMRDLEIRGAGDLLGVQQSGNVSTVGFHFYCKLLKRAVDTLKKKTSPSFYDTRMEFKYEANLPSSYIPETSLRMEIYHRLGEACSRKDVDELFDELKDRFGELPPSTIWLKHLSRIRAFASQHQFTLLKFDTATLTVERQEGKETTLKKTFLPPFNSPQELEEKVIEMLCFGFELAETS